MAVQSFATTDTSIIETDGDRKVLRSKVSETGAARIASMVVNMYADPTSAVTREYVANAVDATIAAGSTKAVEVTVPTALTPTLVIRDYGTGMDARTLEDAFLAFAESTKGDTNDQVGGLGVGAKSAWTICESFIVDTVKDGKRNIVRAARDLEHEVMVSDATVDMPNGTTVTIPVNVDSANWREEVVKAAVFHKGGAVLVDGEPVKSVQDGKWIGPVRVGRVDASPSSYTVLSGGTMFGVPQTLTPSFREKLDGVPAIVELPVGSFSHTPSRDYLIADERTNRALEVMWNAYAKAHDALTRRVVRKAKTDITAAITLRSEYLNGERSRKIAPLPYGVRMNSSHTYLPSRRGSSVSVWRSATTSRYEWSSYEISPMLARTVIVTDVPKDKALKGIGRYMDSLHFNVAVVIAVPEGESTVAYEVTGTTSEVNTTFNLGANTPGVTSVKYDDMMTKVKELSALYAEKRTPAAKLRYETLRYIGGKVSSGSYTLDEIAGHIAEVDGSVDLAYGDTSRYRTLTRVAPSQDFIIIDNGRRSAKPIVERFPEVIMESVYRDRVVTAAEKELSDDDVARYVLTDNYTSRFAYLAVVADAISQRDDAPAEVVASIKKLASMSQVDTSVKVSDAAHTVLSARRYTYGDTRASALTSELDGEWKSLVASYPLLEGVSPSFLTDGTSSSRNEVLNRDKVTHLVEYILSVAPIDATPDL